MNPILTLEHWLDQPNLAWTDEDWLKVITQCYQVDETQWLNQLIPWVEQPAAALVAISERAANIVHQVRAQSDFTHAVDQLLQEYSLDNEEGVILMCLAEALLRVPDAETADDLIRDKLSPADWQAHLGHSESIWVNASSWGLMLTGKITQWDAPERKPGNLLQRLINRAGEPVIRQAMHQAMRVMGRQFVLGQTIEEALKNGQSYRDKGYTYSFDMLGEAALTERDAQRYWGSYQQAIQHMIDFKSKWPTSLPLPTISIKLSALHPRYEAHQEERVLHELTERVAQLLVLAQAHQIGVTIDAEEADRLELSLLVFRAVYERPDLGGYGGFGMVVQAYSKRALPVLAYLNELARRHGDPIPVRLVKGAYWDSEIKLAQQLGTDGYPVYTRKENTDVAYLACARYLLSDPVQGHLQPQFATHNAYTVAAIEYLGQGKVYEFQRLHGMGDALYDTLMAESQHPVRIYAPVGMHQDLLPYLVRRLLENGANSSFVHRLVDAQTPVEQLVESPLDRVRGRAQHGHPKIPLPAHIFGGQRLNSQGANLNIQGEREALMAAVDVFADKQWEGGPIIDGEMQTHNQALTVRSPHQRQRWVGSVYYSTSEQAQQALRSAHAYGDTWRQTPAEERAAAVDQLADLLEQHRAELIALCTLEAGKTLQDGIDEVREAVDFCRYYAQQARLHFSQAQVLPGLTGERNELYYEGRGVFLCISPWNFPLAIFLGQITAALVAGNTVLAKPAETTSLIAARAVQLAHEAGIPTPALQLLPGLGAELGQALLPEAAVVGVAFTGSTHTAHLINRQLAEREGAIPLFIAETGGQNAMIVDSTALPEQVVRDVIQSGFTSAGQRCSALRVLCIQVDNAERVLDILRGAMDELVMGDPAYLSTDVGPVINTQAQTELLEYIEAQREAGCVLHQTPLTEACQQGTFVPPTLIRLSSVQELGPERFGPIVHVLTYRAAELSKVLAEIQATGYGLTLGIHSRNELTAARIERQVRVGNCYVNRNQIGAVVGVQPFGGRGLSGTGPKAGGPNYVLRFATERTRTINTTAVGGNASLLSLGDDA
jgi:RHH-type proline utilization regulon transcriptional repressor/proline dehydrogenase/delta 1-pyrroline-5-carboxylate dehydrogenase